MSVFEFLEMVDAHSHEQREGLRIRAAQACWIINAIPSFGRGRKKAVKPSDLVQLDGEEIGDDGVLRTKSDRKGLTREHMNSEKAALFEKFSKIGSGKYGSPRRFKSLNRR